MREMAVAIEVNHLKKYYDGGRLKVLEDVSFQCMEKEFVSIIGPSGCGKSTIFNLITGIEEATGGKILVEGAVTDPRTPKAAYMPQRDLLLPWLRVLDNVVIGLEIDGATKKERYGRAYEYLELFGLDGFEDKYPSELSGGMKQRAAFLRTVLTEKRILLLDEPFGALDALTRLQMQKWLLTIRQRLSRTVLFITHDIDEAIFLSDRVVVLSPRPATVLNIIDIYLPGPERKDQLLSREFTDLKKQLLEQLQIH